MPNLVTVSHCVRARRRSRETFGTLVPERLGIGGVVERVATRAQLVETVFLQYKLLFVI